MKQVGVLLSIAVVLLVGLALFTGGIAPNIGSTTQTVSYVNQTVTAAAAGSAVELQGKDLVGTAIVTNATGVGGAIAATNFTFSSSVGSDGQKSLFMTTAANSVFASKSVNVTYTTKPDGYIEDASGRSIALLIPILVALGLALIALVPALREKILSK